MSVVEVQRRPRPTVGEFLCEVAAVVADLPPLATAPLRRGLGTESMHEFFV